MVITSKKFIWLFNNGTFVFVIYINSTKSGNNYKFYNPVIYLFGGNYFFKEKASIFKILALVFGFLFTIIALNPTINISFGCYIGLLAAIFHAIAALIVKELTKTESVLSLMFFMVIFMSILHLSLHCFIGRFLNLK